MATIRITVGNTQTGNLTMIDSNSNSASTIHVNRGEIITWQIQPGSGVSALTAIDKKDLPGNQNDFSELSRNFISWNDSSEINYTDDPLIQVNPIVIKYVLA